MRFAAVASAGQPPRPAVLDETGNDGQVRFVDGHQPQPVSEPWMNKPSDNS